ncbi:MAG: hypothetical protein M1819_004562 [Sarea resinae]|nr:MAG: hypothetical protein M1819_004562 [Sarea resinae]
MELPERPAAAAESPDRRPSTDTEEGFRDGPLVVYGLRLHIAVLGMSLALFLSALETTIIATSLLKIATHFQDLERSNWVVTMYLVTYNGTVTGSMTRRLKLSADQVPRYYATAFLIIFARLSDNFGRRNLLFVALFIFALFSGLCGASQSMVQLIIFRTFQGIGGSGLYSIVMITFPDVVPVRLFGIYSGILSSVFALANILGPVLGGIITGHGSWRWIFLLNVPGAVVSALILFPTLPASKDTSVTLAKISRVDFVGSLLSVTAVSLLVYGLEAGGDTNPWDSAIVIACLTVGVSCFILFASFEYELGQFSSVDPVFPLRLLRKPVLMFLLLSAFFMGFPFYATIINLPQRYQQVNDVSSSMAGIRLLPMLLSSAVAAGLSGAMCSKHLRWSQPVLVTGAVLQAVGTGLLATLPATQSAAPEQYGFEVIVGCGFGLMMPVFMILTRAKVSDDDNAIIISSTYALRTLGGCIGVAVCAALLHNSLPKKLDFLPPQEVSGLLHSAVRPSNLSEDDANRVREAFSYAYDQQMWVMAIPAALSFVVGLGTFWKYGISLRHTLS